MWKSRETTNALVEKNDKMKKKKVRKITRKLFCERVDNESRSRRASHDGKKIIIDNARTVSRGEIRQRNVRESVARESTPVRKLRTSPAVLSLAAATAPGRALSPGATCSARAPRSPRRRVTFIILFHYYYYYFFFRPRWPVRAGCDDVARRFPLR